MPKRTLQAILKAAGLTVEEFSKL
ncbi:MAG: hypothetical protein NTV33_09430 [Coprothermobacterota bacterium]|nr:hypothetical protein [Coprothermobacterota bacterium]